MASSNTPKLLSTASLDSETDDDAVVIASQSSQIEQELPAPAHTSKTELLSWLRHHKRAAGFHLKRYLHFKELWYQESNASGAQSPSRPGVPPLALTLKDNSSVHGENYWNMKAEKDFLIADLTAIENILGQMSVTFGTRQWTETVGMVVATSLCGISIIVPTMGLGLPAVAAMGSLLFAYDPVKRLVYNSIIRLYKSETLLIKDSAETESLGKDITVPRFKLLGWMD